MTTDIDARITALEDAEAVRQLVARYHLACDGWDERGTHRDVAAIAALFTPDGVWDVPAQQDGVFAGDARLRIAGRAAIMDFARGLQAIPWIIHFVVNPLVAVDGDSASGAFKGFVRFKGAGTDPVWVCGIYRVEAMRTPDGWCFSRLAWDHLDTM
jgi:hypothetical protein